MGQFEETVKKHYCARLRRVLIGYAGESAVRLFFWAWVLFHSHAPTASAFIHTFPHTLFFLPSPPKSTTMFAAAAASRNVVSKAITQSHRGYKVAVLGAAGGIGQPCGLLMKIVRNSCFLFFPFARSERLGFFFGFTPLVSSTPPPRIRS